MDYSLAAVKVMCRQLKDAKAAATDEDDSVSDSQSKSFSLGGILFQRVWLQGLLVSPDPNDPTLFVLDDATGVIHLSIHPDFRKRDWNPGTYVMVVGGYLFREEDKLPMIRVHKIVDLSPYPDREAMWYLEVIEAYKMFYQPLFE